MSVNDLATAFARRPQLAVWLNFRLASMSAYIERLAGAARAAATAHNPGLKLGIDVHLPAICALVGTDLDLCGRLFDWVSPKFPDYMPGSVIPMAAQAIAAAGRFDEAELRQGLRDLCDLGPRPRRVRRDRDGRGRRGPSTPTPTTPASSPARCPTSPRSGARCRSTPGPGSTTATTTAGAASSPALRESGLDGYFLWCWESDLTPEALAASKGIF